ncbi:hypothetical protein NGRA_1051 [Nosema granulosis]|uniref:Uncharacterized protein n=1 Tax=Nosema granulosis TaxID=83296 RepID=A0A9P6H2F3_9MICR|nr:hypothetical protein NGRA_1051 [Nosema granulosis]
MTLKEYEEIKKYISEDLSLDPNFDVKKALVYKDKDYLIQKGLWTEAIKRKIISYNTLHNFTNIRKVQIQNNFFAYSLLHLIFKYQIEYPKGIEGDVLMIQDLCLSKGIEYVDVDYFFRLNRKPTKEFVKYLYENNGLDSTMLEEEEYYEKLLELEDFECDFKKRVFNSVASKFKFIKRQPYNEWYKYKDVFTDDFLIEHMGSFRYKDLLSLRNEHQLYSLMERASYQERYKLYSNLILDENTVMETRKQLKSLVKANIANKKTKFFSLACLHPLSVIYECIEQIVCFAPLIELVGEVISCMDQRIKDVFVFYILKYIQKKDSFVKEDCFARWFVNISSLLKHIYSHINSLPVIDYIKELLRRRKYSCVLLLESIKIPKDVYSSLKGVHRKVFKYEDYDLKLKMDVSDKYSILINRQVKIHPTVDNFKYMTPYEVRSIQKSHLDHVEKLIKAIDILEEDYFAIRNLALIVSTFKDSLLPYHNKIAKLFTRYSEHEDKDVKVLCLSVLSKLVVTKEVEKSTKSIKNIQNEVKRQKIEDKKATKDKKPIEDKKAIKNKKDIENKKPIEDKKITEDIEDKKDIKDKKITEDIEDKKDIKDKKITEDIEDESLEMGEIKRGAIKLPNRLSDRFPTREKMTVNRNNKVMRKRERIPRDIMKMPPSPIPRPVVPPIPRPVVYPIPRPGAPSQQFIPEPGKRVRECYLYDKDGRRIKNIKDYYRRGFPKDFYY